MAHSAAMVAAAAERDNDNERGRIELHFGADTGEAANSQDLAKLPLICSSS